MFKYNKSKTKVELEKEETSRHEDHRANKAHGLSMCDLISITTQRSSLYSAVSHSYFSLR